MLRYFVIVRSHGASVFQSVLPMYFAARKCLVCEEASFDEICAACNSDPQSTALSISRDINSCERQLQQIAEVRNHSFYFIL